MFSCFNSIKHPEHFLIMNTLVKKGLFFLVPLLTILFVSCKSDKEDFIEVSENQELKSNSKAVELIRKTTMNDGSGDNILDGSSCFTVVLPVTIDLNGTETNIDTEQDFQIIEQIFSEFEDDEDIIEFIFPITIVLSDFSEIFIEDSDQWEELTESCEENEGEDEDIECIDFVYPITVSVFNPETELLETIIFASDKEFFDFVEDLEDDDIVNISFPILVVFSDNSNMIINDIGTLEDIIENAIDDCDENDFTIKRLSEVITTQSFIITRYKDNQDDETEIFQGHIFNFYTDKTATVTIEEDDVDDPQNTTTITINGTWSVATRTDGGLDVTLDFGLEIPLDKLNNTWNVKGINDKSIMLGHQGNNELFFEIN